MRTVKIHANPIFRFDLTDAELSALIELSRSHYDGLCKSLSSPGVGSFIHGWRVLMEHSDSKSIQVSADWRRLDLLLKVTERNHLIGNTIHREVRNMMDRYEKSIAPHWIEEIVVGEEI